MILNNIKIIYSSPAYPLYGIRLNQIYTLNGDTEKGCILDDGNFEQVLSLNMIKQMFTPIDTSWDILEREYKKKTTKVVVED